jgi:hypothetical protein
MRPYVSICTRSNLSLFQEVSLITDPTLTPGEVDVPGVPLEYVVRSEGDILYVMYSGTIGPLIEKSKFGFRLGQDWAKDADLRKVDFPDWKGVKCYHGFLGEYQLSEADVFAALKSTPPKEVCIVGYSKGSVHATYLACRILRYLPNMKVSVRAFASPKGFSFWGSLKVDSFFSKNCDRLDFQRVTVAGDLVPHLPPFIGGQVGTEKVVGTWPWPFSSPLRHYPTVYRENLS